MGTPTKRIRPSKTGKTRVRRTDDERAAAEGFLIAYAAAHARVSVRQLYYAAGMAKVPGIGKDEKHYRKIQQDVLKLRQNGALPYWQIADRSRRPHGFPGYRDPGHAVDATAEHYKLDPWRHRPCVVEVWIDKDALVGVVDEVTDDEYRVRLMPYRGSTSETFAWEAIQHYRGETRPIYFLHLGDLDLYGFDAQNTLRMKLSEFAAKAGLEVHFHHLGLTWAQVAEHRLESAQRPQKWPTHPTARKSARQRWPHEQAVELDALPPDVLRDLLRSALAPYMPDRVRAAAARQEETDKELLRKWAQRFKKRR